MPVPNYYFIGIDLTDPFARNKRPCDRAILDNELKCLFDRWDYEPGGDQIIPESIIHEKCILAIDGPQGLAGNEEDNMRLSEHELRTAGKSPYTFPVQGKPYAGFIKGSVQLFFQLDKSGRFHLFGFGNDRGYTNLIEVYPGAAWPVLAGHRLPNKKLVIGRQSRYELLKQLGLKFDLDDTVLPTHDQLDAAVAAYTAYLFFIRKATEHGLPPFEDKAAGVIREGFILQPIKMISCAIDSIQ